MGLIHSSVAGDIDPAPEVKRVVGAIAELWRYPVKSMLGSTVSEVMVTDRGVLGDRAWALRDHRTGRIVSAKRVPDLLRFRATYEVEPTLESAGLVRIETPDGDTIYAGQDNASARISGILGRQVVLENSPFPDEKTSVDRGTVFGDVPVSQMKPDWTPETMPDYFQLKGGTFLEIGAVFLLASGSVEHLRGLQGGTALIDRRRFRPNLYINSGPASGRFIEDDWLGGNLTVGDSVALGQFAPTLWCVGSTLAQEELPRDLSILRTIARGHKGCLGVYGSVVSGGLVRVGDPVVLAESAVSALE
ncbi:MAG TPA: MOSC N-terminal beta barrel domain-containing protein [Streptosporangiaceae bacterium]|nr:MOSC N-terminal beta barrel domain-containing protein [Streptosporangiaceae bacterium]